jgi:hypothetical protein
MARTITEHSLSRSFHESFQFDKYGKNDYQAKDPVAASLMLLNLIDMARTITKQKAQS